MRRSKVKRLIHEASIRPTGRVYDVMTAHWLSDGVRPSLEEAVRINYNITLPKTLGASDWSVDVLSPEQLGVRRLPGRRAVPGPLDHPAEGALRRVR
jgi:hypothetical protein